MAFSSRNAPSSLSPIQQLEAEIRERPSVAELYLQLAQIYLDKDREYDADRLLAKGRDATDRDPRVIAMWEDVTMHRHAKRVQGAEEDVAAADSTSKEKAQQALAQAIKDRDRAELEVFRGRCQRKPDEAANQYELGVRLKRAEKLPDAREHLEKALAEPEQKAAAALELGHCHMQLGEMAKALHYYRVAAIERISNDDLEVKQQARSCAATLADSLKLGRLAKRYQAISY
jgi:tetratricopeptide (TPR) repeat protein